MIVGQAGDQEVTRSTPGRYVLMNLQFRTSKKIYACYGASYNFSATAELLGQAITLFDS